MIFFTLILLAFNSTADEPLPKPVGMILDLKGKVELRETNGPLKLASLGDLLYPGERIAVPIGSIVTIAILRQAVQETLKTGAEVTIESEGCLPAELVEKRTIQRRAVALTMDGLLPEQNNARKAGVLLRGDLKSQITPIVDATISMDRPRFAWKAAEGATTYGIKLYEARSSKLIWSAETKVPHLEFAAENKPLLRGVNYRWSVSDQDSDLIAQGKFKVADDSELDQIEGLSELRNSESRADRVAAALAYQRLRAYSEAIDAFKQLAKESPNEPLFRHALAELHEQAGHPKSAQTPPVGE